MQVKSTIGEILNLGSTLGGGGEANVFHLMKDNTLCAKIYKDHQKASSLEKKVEEMIDIYKVVRKGKGEEEHFFDKHLAWPRLKLYEPKTGAFVGFIMNKLPLHIGFGLDVLLNDDMHGEKSWSNRLEIALNLLQVIGFLHKQGIIAGDLHKENIFVLPHNEIALVDCDSFQIGNKFRCSALQPEIAPPESKDVKYFDASADMFTVCVLLYRLLMDGYSPFSYIQEGSFEPDLEQSKASGFAPICNNQLEVPPQSPPLKRLPDETRNVFARALAPNPKNRPSIDELIAAVKIVKKNVKIPLTAKKRISQILHINVANTAINTNIAGPRQTAQTVTQIHHPGRRFFEYGIIGAAIGVILRGILTGVGHFDDWLFHYYKFLTWKDIWNNTHGLTYIAIMIPVFFCLVASLYLAYRIVKK